MEHETHPHAQTAAAALLRTALATYTAQHKGGLRALSVELGMRPPTVLSHMANGRMPIPLERAGQIADALHLDRLTFCLAVLAQRAPSIATIFHAELGLSQADAPIAPTVKETIRRALQSPPSDGLIELLRRALQTPAPLEHWVDGEEFELLRAIRRETPSGLDFETSLEIRDLFGAVVHEVLKRDA